MPRKQTSWSQAFLEQAQEDFDAAFRRYRLHCDGSVFFMLLQMSFEKASKAAAYQTLDNSRRPPKIHDVIPLLQGMLARRNANVKGFYERHKEAFDFLVNRVAKLQPSLVNGEDEQLEYPWINRYQQIKCPAKDLSIVSDYFNRPSNTTLPLVMLAMQEFLKNFRAIIHKIS